MKKLTPFLLLVLLFLACNKSQAPVTCAALYCAISLPVTVTYVDNSNNGIAVKNFNVLDLRTGQMVNTSGNNNLSVGTYAVADPGDLGLFLPAGDNLQVSATDSLTNQTKTVDFKIAGGTCTCDVTKVSGPDTVKFN